MKIKEGVSIVMPCFNAANTILQSIESVQNQTHEAWELIIVDDGSSDNSIEIVEQVEKEDKRIRLVRQPNSGPSVARNNGVNESKNNYIAFLDSDDAWTREHLGSHLKLMAEYPDVGISFSSCLFMDEDGKLTGEKTRKSSAFLTKETVLSSNPTTTCSTLFFRKNVFERAGGLREDMKYAEDQEWLFRVLHFGYDIAPVGSRTVLYRTSENGLSSDLDKMASGWEQFIQNARELDSDTVQRSYKKAKTAISLYHARRSVRTDQNFMVSIKYLRRAVFEGHLSSLKQYFQVMFITIAAIFPRAFNAIYSSVKVSLL